MRHSLHAHVLYLENSLQDVRNRLTQANLTPEEVEDLQLQLALGESALEHYRRAYELELNFAGSEPPNNSARGEPTGGTDKGAKPKPKAGSAAIAAKVSRAKDRHWAGRLSGTVTASRIRGTHGA